jgi:hypothetical protein
MTNLGNLDCCTRVPKFAGRIIRHVPEVIYRILLVPAIEERCCRVHLTPTVNRRVLFELSTVKIVYGILCSESLAGEERLRASRHPKSETRNNLRWAATPAMAAFVLDVRSKRLPGQPRVRPKRPNDGEDPSFQCLIVKE